MSAEADRIEQLHREVWRLQNENAALREECAEGAATANGWAEEAKGLHAEAGRLHRALRELADEWHNRPQGDIGSDRRAARQLRDVLGWRGHKGSPNPAITAIRDDIAVLADEWENYECECENPDTGPYCLHRYTVHDFGRMLRNRLIAAVSPYE